MVQEMSFDYQDILARAERDLQYQAASLATWQVKEREAGKPTNTKAIQARTLHLTIMQEMYNAFECLIFENQQLRHAYNTLEIEAQHSRYQRGYAPSHSHQPDGDLLYELKRRQRRHGLSADERETLRRLSLARAATDFDL